MNKFTKPAELNGEQLIAELKKAGISIPDGAFPEIDGAGDFWLPVANKDITKAEAVVAAHVGIDTSSAQEAAKAALLDRLGITADEAKLLLSRPTSYAKPDNS